MAAKNQPDSRGSFVTRFQRSFLWLLLCFLGILSVSGTIALRNTLLVILLGMFVWALLNPEQRRAMQLPTLVQAVPRAVWAWLGFLLIFPVFAVESTLAWNELLLHWSESILTWVLAIAAVAVLRGCGGPQLWALTWASAVPVLLHLALVPLAMSGLLRGGFEADPGLPMLGTTLAALAQNPSSVSVQWQPIMGFRGIEPMHGNIGYPASQTLVLALACWLHARRQGRVRGTVMAVFLIVACLLSGLITSSRGAVLFNGLLLLLAAGIGVFVHRLQRRHGAKVQSLLQHWRAGVAVLVVASVLASLFVAVVRHDERWQTMLTKMLLGFATQQPLDTLCNGLSAQDISTIRSQAQGRGAGYENSLAAGVEVQDGARMLLLRAGLELVWEHPRGQDGSRQAFEKIMLKSCGHIPKLNHAHAHNAWINLALSVGWLGVGLFAWLLCSFARQGWQMLRLQSEASPLGYALFLLAVFWMLRGAADAVFQDHYLQMQAILLLSLLLLGRSYQVNQDLKVS